MSGTRDRAARFLGIEGVPILLGVALVSVYFAVTVPSFIDTDALQYYLNEEVHSSSSPPGWPWSSSPEGSTCPWGPFSA